MSWTFAWEGQIRSWDLKGALNLPIKTPHHKVPDQKPTRNLRLEASTSAGTDMETGVNDRRVRFQEEKDSSRHHLDASSDRESMEEPRRKIARRAETREPVVPFRSSEASSSELQQVSAAVSDISTGATPREHDRGRTFGIPQNDDATRPTRTMDADQRRKNDEHPVSKGGETKLLRQRRGVDGTPRYLGTAFLPKNECSFRKQSKPNGKEYWISRR